MGQQLPKIAKSQSVKTANTYLNNPLCYMQTSDGRVIDLTHLCGQSPTANLGVPSSMGGQLPTTVSSQGVPSSMGRKLPKTASSQAPQVYNSAAIRAFDDSVYGKGN